MVEWVRDSPSEVFRIVAGSKGGENEKSWLLERVPNQHIDQNNHADREYEKRHLLHLQGIWLRCFARGRCLGRHDVSLYHQSRLVNGSTVVGTSVM